MLSSRFQRFTNYKNIYLLDTLEGLIMSPPHFRFYDEAPGRTLIIEQVPLSYHVVPVFRNNLYWSTDSGAQSASIFPDERNWVEWQASGNDTGSVWSQPLFRWI